LADDRGTWFREARFGLFLHWGPYSVAGVEASWPIMAPELAALLFGAHPAIGEAEYVALAQRFNPVDYDPGEWVRLARQAGVRYLVITAKHHDGFCLFDASGTDFKITNTPYGRDVCAELAAACGQEGMRLCFYYSPPDMHHPGYRDTSKPAVKNWWGEPRRREWPGYLDYMASHLHKLLTGYGPVAAIWFDGLFGHEKYDPPRFHRLIRELSPATLVNDRLGEPYDFITPEQFIPRQGVPIRCAARPVATDGQIKALLTLFKVPGIGAWLKRSARRYAAGELELTKIATAPHPAPEEFQPWETCMTMNRSWAYNPTDMAYKTPQQLIRNLVRVAGRGGNYLLNVGPTPRGTFPPEAQDRLQHIGKWLAVNGEAIYGTNYGPLPDLPCGTTTARNGAVYLHLWDWPAAGRVVLDRFPAQVASVRLLAGNEPLPFTQSVGSLSIDLPAQAPDPIVTVLTIHTASESGAEDF
jgi:alpha-L-fucosidase